ncbi:magnesium citrate secondary transporter [Pontibacter sp. H259]|uniref:magnesium citrate secondary transporter n=1 Tax=Pontibacter sp. H259 TaxID=3133421 RepID=UPI0030C3740E
MVHYIAGRLNWKTLSPLFWVLAALYSGHWVWRWLAFPRPAWLQNYFDDLLCLPLVLTATLFVMRIFYGSQLRLSGYHVAFTILYFSVAFEVFFPKFMPRYTADFADVLLYIFGGIFFHRFLNK